MTMSSAGTLVERRNDRSVILDRITRTRREQALIAVGHSAPIARAVAAGDLAVRIRTIDLARSIGLIALIDTTEARAAGLIK